MREETMNRSGKVQVAIIILLVALALGIGGWYFMRGNEIVASFKGGEVTKEELYQAMLEQGGQGTLDYLIQKKLIEQEADKQKVTVSAEEIDQELALYIQQNFMGMEDYFYQVLEQNGLDIEMFKEDLRVNLLAKKMVLKTIEITDEEAEEYFEEKQSQFDIKPQVEARHILLETEEEAWEVIGLLDAGEDFEALAKERSLDEGSKEEGGYLDYFEPGKMVKEFEDAAFALEVGQRSEPVKTAHGYHVIEVLGRIEGRTVTFGEVKEDVIARMSEEKIPELIGEFYAGLLEKAEVKYNLKG